MLLKCRGSRGSSVGVVTGYGLDVPGSIPGSARFFSSPQRPDRLWGPSSLLSNGCRGMKLATHLHLVTRSRVVSSWLSAKVIKHRNNFTVTFELSFIDRTQAQQSPENVIENLMDYNLSDLIWSWPWITLHCGLPFSLTVSISSCATIGFTFKLHFVALGDSFACCWPLHLYVLQLIYHLLRGAVCGS
jgi:hypothetical protein